MMTKEGFIRMFNNHFQQNHPQKYTMLKIYDILLDTYNMQYWIRWGELGIFCSDHDIPEPFQHSYNYKTLQFTVWKTFIYLDIFFRREDKEFVDLIINKFPDGKKQFMENLDFKEKHRQRNLPSIGQTCKYEVANLSMNKLFSLSIKIENSNNLECLFIELEPFINKIKENN